jgi:hypothetical protein
MDKHTGFHFVGKVLKDINACACAKDGMYIDIHYVIYYNDAE